MTAIEKYLAPRTVEEATRIAVESGVTILAGGTDLQPRWSRQLTARPAAILDLKRIDEFKGVRQADGEVRIGACTPLSEIASDAIIRAAAPVLAEAAGRVASPQIRNRATIGGNLCNASPAADTAVPLILLDAVLDLACSGPDGLTVREVPITGFFRGPGSTALKPGEILTHIRFRPWSDLEAPRGLKSAARPSVLVAKSAARPSVFVAWDKFGTRRAMEIAVASVGVALRVEAGTVTDARVGYGSVAPVPLRGRKAEAQLVGNPLSAEVIGKCEAAAREEIAPITDVRAGEAYRREVVGVMLRRMLERATCD